MTEFAGFEMPLSYSGIIQEHRAVRVAAGPFDLSHMGEIELRGNAALPLLERALTNSATRLADGHAQYSLMCADDGGTLDDLVVYRLERDRFMLCVNAANAQSDRQWLASLSRPGAEIVDLSESVGLIAIQGPRAQAILTKVSRLGLSEISRFQTLSGEIAGMSCLVARTGYTGEDGFEIFVAAQYAPALFEALLNAGAGDGLVPCGLGARDTLRMEASLALYGHELDRSITPLEAGLARFVRFGHGFIGEAVLLAERNQGPRRHLIGIRTDDGRSIARQGCKLFHNLTQVGVVTSGTFAPSFDRPLAIGLVDAVPALEPEAPVAVQIRNRMVPASVVSLPFYRRASGG